MLVTYQYILIGLNITTYIHTYLTLSPWEIDLFSVVYML